ncbi:MAG: hypothetical protein GY839_13485 [candidate division Zixibacteria bacterium]|nr:hypothetical protein [candidate division Zixibacteria bacterium]
MFTILVNAYDHRGLTRADIEALGLFERIYFDNISAPVAKNRFWSRVISEPAGRIEVRRYSRNLNEITDYFYLDLKENAFKVRTDLKKRDNNYSISNRSMSWNKEYASVTLGNFIAKEGFGLAIGRFDYQPSAGLEGNDEFDLQYPVNSYYNGIRLTANSGRFGGRAYYSRKKYGEALKSFYGSGFNIGDSTISGGAAFGWNRFEMDNANDETLAAGINIRLYQEYISLAGEYAIVEKSGGFFLRSECRLTDFILTGEFWRYANHYNNFNSTGPAASDYNTFFPGQNELGFRSAQAGETGLSLNYILNNLKAGVQFWSHTGEPDINSSFNIKYRAKLTDRINTSFQTLGKIRNSGGYLWAKLILMTDWPLLNQTGSKLYFMGKSKLIKNVSYSFVYLARNFNENTELFLNIRNYYDGRITWFVGEDLKVAAGIDISVEITRDKFTKLNVRIEKSL